MAVVIDGTNGVTTPAESVTGTGVWSVGGSQIYKDASGNVGVGTSSPQAKLHVSGGYAAFQHNSSGAYPTYNTYFGAIGTNFQGGASYLDFWNTVGSGFQWHIQTGASTQSSAMTLDSSGNLLVGTTSGSSKLTVNGTGTVGYFTTSGNASSATVAIQAANGAGYDARLYFECPGSNIGGLTYQRANNRLYAYSQSEFSGPYVGALGTSWTTGSDIRLKTDIQDITYGLDSVMALSPKKYAYLNNAEKQCFGLIAQDVIGIIPEIVDAPQDSSAMMGIEYQALIPVLVKAIQELKAIIDTQATRITALEAK